MQEHHMNPLLQKPFIVMGVVNVTPDSFFDGGRYVSAGAAIAHGCALAAEGADILDIGGESTRPGAATVGAGEESTRILPVIEALAKKTAVPISVDTTKSEVASRAFAAGATWVNDISAGRFDTSMPQFAARAGCPVILMHSRETPATMQADPQYRDVVAEVKAELLERVAVFTGAGVRKENIIIDPGIGFAKRLEDNLALIRRLSELTELGYPVCVGLSRKSFVGRITGRDAEGRLAGTLAALAPARQAGARLFRVHDVRETLDALKVLDAIKNS
jgi:dihydropteroate synthase